MNEPTPPPIQDWKPEQEPYRAEVVQRKPPVRPQQKRPSRHGSQMWIPVCVVGATGCLGAILVVLLIAFRFSSVQSSNDELYDIGTYLLKRASEQRNTITIHDHGRKVEARFDAPVSNLTPVQIERRTGSGQRPRMKKFRNHADNSVYSDVWFDDCDVYWRDIWFQNRQSPDMRIRVRIYRYEGAEKWVLDEISAHVK